jgi:hypothetical protein
MIKDPVNVQIPLVGAKSKCLGVRPAGHFADIDLNEAGLVILNQKGMSVSQDWRTLKPHLIPQELDDGLNGASGKGMAVFVHGQGTGAFAEGVVANGLEMCFKNGTTIAGNVCPTVSVSLEQYQDDLAATQTSWVIDPS